ncbi:hypothetical protein BRADI_3g61009v3 [Brachypodium distachyon]|uniref:Uncharacterized protein n=1 Tax=Brachypodium distachyon TaxID=15368 RepID=A0A2K2D656_BRADI|nr:hypothetical protein BRADI_3g61009v3 [Brachypodium distachyon]
MAIDPTEPGYTRKRGRKSKVATPEVTTELRRSPRLNMYRGFKSHQISDAHKKRQSIGESILLFFFFAGPRRGRKNSSELSTLTTLVRGGAESSRPPGGPCTPLPAARRSGCSSSWFSERWRRMRRGSRGRGVNAPPQLTLCPRCRRGEAERCPHLALEGHGRGAAVNAKVKQARISWAKMTSQLPSTYLLCSTVHTPQSRFWGACALSGFSSLDTTGGSTELQLIVKAGAEPKLGAGRS